MVPKRQQGVPNTPNKANCSFSNVEPQTARAACWYDCSSPPRILYRLPSAASETLGYLLLLEPKQGPSEWSIEVLDVLVLTLWRNCAIVGPSDRLGHDFDLLHNFTTGFPVKNSHAPWD